MSSDFTRMLCRLCAPCLRNRLGHRCEPRAGRSHRRLPELIPKSYRPEVDRQVQLARLGAYFHLARHCWPDDLSMAAIEMHGHSRLLPPPVVARFERKFADNRRRVDQLADQFDSLNQRFNRAGVNYAVIKGFALVPE